MWGAFPCPRCHKLLRARRNFTIRILRLALITGALCYFLAGISDWLRHHIPVGVFITAVTIGVIDEYVMRLLPAEIDPAIPGGLIAH
jgi:hypothetical protein